MKRKLMALMLVLAMALSLGTLAACGGGTPSPSASNNPSAGTDDTVYKLKVSTTRGENTWFAQMYNDIAAELKEKSNGRLVLEIFHNNTLGAPADIWTMFTTGGIDMLDMSPGMVGSFTVSEVLNIPFYLDGNENVGNMMWDLYDSGLLSEYTDHMKVLMFLPAGGIELFTSKAPIESVSDWKGLKACASSSMMSMAIERLGGTAVSTSPSEQVMSLTQGVLDGVITGATFAEIMSLYEAGKYMMRQNMAISCMFFGINNNSYNKLPADLQQLLTETCSKWYSDYYIKTIESDYAGVLERLASKGVTIYEPSEQLLADMKSACADLVGVYEQKLTDSGIDKDAVMAVVSKYVK